MKPGKRFQSPADFLLRPLRKRAKRKRAFTMQGALSRVQEHGFEVRTVIDVGASNGKWAKMAHELLPASRVLAFEPLVEQRQTLEELKSSVSWFDYVQAVAGEEPGEVSFFVSGDLDGSGVSEEAGQDSRNVPVTTIDSEVQQRGLPGPYLIKLDTHGFELPILSGAAQTLEQASVVIIEVYNFKLNHPCLRFPEMCQHMESLGFRSYDMADPLLRAKDQALWQLDLFFARKDAAIFAHAKYT